MAEGKRTVLITGCSDGGMGAELAKEFHKAGLHVYATARSPSKMASLKALGVETLPLDVQNEESIRQCVAQIPRLDVLINNAGASYTMPIADMSLAEGKKLFDINLWGHIAVTQAVLPLLLKSPKAVIANHTSVGVGMAIPFQASYNASKAALSKFTETLRLELEPFNISVVELRTGSVKTEIVSNVQAQQNKLPADSIYAPAREVVDKALRLEWVEGKGITTEQWAKEVVADLLKESPAPVVWRGESAWAAWFAGFFPSSWFDGMTKKFTSLDKAGEVIRASRSA